MKRDYPLARWMSIAGGRIGGQRPALRITLKKYPFLS
jgi:hypothetical protein